MLAVVPSDEIDRNRSLVVGLAAIANTVTVVSFESTGSIFSESTEKSKERVPTAVGMPDTLKTCDWFTSRPDVPKGVLRSQLRSKPESVQ